MDMEKENRLEKALERFDDILTRLRERQRRERRFLERCDKCLKHLREFANTKRLQDAVETLGDLVIFRHTDGDGRRIRLIMSGQRDRAIINERFLNTHVEGELRDGSDILLAIHSLSKELNPNRCLIYQLLKPVEIFAISYEKGSKEPVPFIKSRFGLVSSKEHLHDFIQQLDESPHNKDAPLPIREIIPDLIETCLEEELAKSIEKRTEALADFLDSEANRTPEHEELPHDTGS